MVTKSNLTTLANIRGRDALFANEFMAAHPLPKGDDGLAIFYSFGNTFAFVEDFRVPSNKGGTFHKEAQGTGFYRSGGSVTIMTSRGMLVVTDERTKVLKPFPVGLAQHSQGHDLTLCCRAEFDQEVMIYTRAKAKVQYAPHGCLLYPRIEALDVSMTVSEEVGELVFTDFFVNEVDRAYECRMTWDISALDINTFSAHYEEDLWFQGGRANIPVWVIDLTTAELAGMFAGQQGFLEKVPSWSLHASVADLCNRAKTKHAA